jgi:hypothetical protein
MRQVLVVAWGLALASASAPCGAAAQERAPRDLRAEALRSLRPGDSLRVRIAEALLSVRLVSRPADSLGVRAGEDAWVLPLTALDTVWVLHRRTGAGLATGGMVGAVSLTVPGVVCAVSVGACLLVFLPIYHTAAALGPRLIRVVGAMGVGVLVGGAIGALIGSGVEAWDQVYPSPLFSDRLLLREPGSGAGLTVDLAMAPPLIARGDSTLAHVTLRNTTRDTLEILDGGCPVRLRVLLDSRNDETFPAACAPSLRVTRLPPGSTERLLWVRPAFAPGNYRTEVSATVLARRRPDPFSAAGATRVVARAGFRIE